LKTITVRYLIGIHKLLYIEKNRCIGPLKKVRKTNLMIGSKAYSLEQCFPCPPVPSTAHVVLGFSPAQTHLIQLIERLMIS
jgi:hypothetical protein